MRKKIGSLLLGVYMVFTLMPTTVLAYGIEINSISVENGIAVIEMASASQGELKIKIYSDAATVFEKTVALSGSTAEVNLPIRNIPLGVYTVAATYIGSNGAQGTSKSITATIGSSSTPVYTSDTQYANSSSNIFNNMQTPGFSRAIMVPYTTVYNSSAMAGKVAELKRLDIVNVLSHNDTVAYVEYTIQSGNGTISVVDDVNAQYDSSDDIRGTGYVYMSSFQTSAKTDEDKQREVVELAYSRLGIRGVYSQNWRYVSYYLDCSAMASWCWYQVGIDFGLWTTCNGLYHWAEGITDKDVIVWDAVENPELAQNVIEDYREANEHHPSDDPDDDPEPCDCVFEFVNGDKTYSQAQITSYEKMFSFDIFEKLEPGDILLFNYTENMTETSHNGAFSFPVNEMADGAMLGGYDHAVLFVGMNDAQTNATLIETSTPSESPGDNTKITTVTATSEKIDSIVAVIRPTGGDTIDGGSNYVYSGAASIGFTGTGTISAPIENFVLSSRGFSASGVVHPVYGDVRPHYGQDMPAAWNTPVYASTDGIVTIGNSGCAEGHNNCGHGGGYGNWVYVDRGDGFQTRYAHLNSIAITSGQEVQAGDIIGYVGSSGTSTGPHLHFEVRINGIAVDPKPFLIG